MKSIEERGRARRIASKAYGAALALFVAILVASLFAGAALAATAVSIPVAHYDAYGNDNYAANLNDEYVVFKNNTTSGIVMTGWKVQDKGSLHTYYFPRGYVLGSGKSVVLHTGQGSNTASH
ncbi:MAG: lamin tail domain-containing protein, partial [Actinomycetota bacterium]|nr:lamin tail domain-containing protein [Actinomycetota bacterium]